MSEEYLNEYAQLPKGWKWVKLGELVDNPKQDLVDGPFGSNMKANEYVKSGVPVFKIQNIKANNFIDKKMCFVTEEKAKTLSRHSFKAGDIIITKLGEPLGLCCEVPDKYPYGIIVADLMRLRPSKEKIHSKYLVYAINSNVVQNQFKKITKGTTRARVNLTIVRDIAIPLGSLGEQQTIVSKIEELLSDLENGIQQLQTAQQQLKTYRQSLLKWAFEGKLTNKNVKEGELPEGWKWAKLGDVSKISGGITKNQKREQMKLKLPFLRVANVYFNRLDLEEIHTIGLLDTEVERVRLEKNDLLFVEGNGSIEQIGRVALWTGEIQNCVHQNHIIKARLYKSVLPQYALYLFCSKIGRDAIKKQASSTSGLHTLSLSKISNLELPITSIEEQVHIVQELESKFTVCDKLEETITQSLQQAETLRQSILKKAFEGR